MKGVNDEISVFWRSTLTELYLNDEKLYILNIYYGYRYLTDTLSAYCIIRNLEHKVVLHTF